MKKTKAENISELDALKLKYSELENKYNEEVTNLKKNEAELQFKIMFLEGVANSTIDGFLVVNPYGQKILQNKRTIELWKIPQDVVDDASGVNQVKHVMNMTVNPQQFLSEINHLREHPNDKSRDELELVDGTVLDRYSSPVLGTDGINYGRIWTFHDITEQKKLERQLIQLNEDKDHFISILSHDLRSPFNSLLGFAGLLKKNIRTYTIEKIETMVDAIHTTSRRTYELLEDTLLWASIQSKRITYNPTIARTTAIIIEVLEILGPSAKTKNITIINNYKEDQSIEIDVYMLKAILRNLLSNAIKFTRENGKIEISVKHTKSDNIFCVSDNGLGIPQERLDDMFRFGSSKSTKGTSNEVGTGLGLILCKEFVDKHGGKIWIESKINKGTSVFFSIPTQLNSASV